MEYQEQALALEFGAVSVQPLPCDRWVARSTFQKAIRRGDTPLATRALANLFLHDPKAVWRHVVIIALEDLGVAGLSVLQQIISAKTDHARARTPGSLWKTFAGLTEQLAGSVHCQAVCDLLLRVENDPAIRWDRELVADGGPRLWASLLYDAEAALERRAIAALCFGGFVPTGKPADPFAVFEVCAEGSNCAEVADLARSAWAASRNPMALLLPIVWSCLREEQVIAIRDDPMTPVQMMNGVPDYALDQFTRMGKAAIRSLVQDDAELQAFFTAAGLRKSDWSQAAGDLIFLVEGGACVRRTVREETERLRRPARWLPGTAMLKSDIEPAMQLMGSKRAQLTSLRRHLFHPAR